MQAVNGETANTSNVKPPLWMAGPLLKYAHVIVVPVVVAAVLHMMPGGGGHSNYRTPPPWEPEVENRYPFRHWARDVLI